MAERTNRRIAVVGGGIAGLAAAWEASAHAGVDVVLHEAGPRFGGRIATSALELSPGRLLVDEGADAFLARVPDAVELCRELGIETQLVSPATGRAQVLVEGALRELPATSVLGVPLDFDDLARTGILSASGLARAAEEPDRARGSAPLPADVAIGSFLDEHYGRELVDHLVGPLIGGINAGDVDRLSLAAVTPQLAEAAADGGSLTEALRRRRATAPPTGAVFLTPEGGMGRLVDAVVEGCRDRGVELVDRSAVDTIEALDADAVVLATPAPRSAALLSGISPDAADALSTLTHASVVLTTFAFERAAVPDTDHSGFLVPRDAGLTMTAASYGSNKWAQWDDDRHMVVRVSAGHAADDGPIASDDEALVATLLAELEATAGIRGTPLVTRISRYPDGFAQYEVGHLTRIDRLEATLARDAPHVRVVGAALRGVGIPACIRGGRSAVRDLLAATR